MFKDPALSKNELQNENYPKGGQWVLNNRFLVEEMPLITAVIYTGQYVHKTRKIYF